MTRQKLTVWGAGTAAIAVLIVVAAWFLVLGPQRATAAETLTATNATEAQNAQLEVRNAALAAQFDQLATRKAQLAEIMATIPGDAELPALLRQLEGSAATSQAVMTSFTASAPELWDSAADPTTVPAVVDVPVTLNVSGSFAETELYLKQLQADSDRFLLIESVSLTSGGAGATSTSASVLSTITGKVFVLTSDPAATTVTTGTTATGTTSTGTGQAAAGTTVVPPAAAEPTAIPTATP